MKHFDLNFKIADLTRFYNKVIMDDGLPYLTVDEAAFEKQFLTPVKEGDAVFALDTADGTGFISGCFAGNIKRFFLTMIVVDPSKRRQGIGTLLLQGLEDKMRSFAEEQGLSFSELEVSYFNPINLTWILPDTDGHRHPNSPGVRLGSSAHLFLKNRGFRDFSYQNSYDLTMQEYEWPQEKLQPYIEKMDQKGLSITFYDAQQHTGMDDLVKDLNNDLWNYQIPEEMNRPGGPRPMLIVDDHGKVGGFAGPVVPGEDGRGFFLGIAIHSVCRGAGAATVLFNRLCLEFKKAGAEYMTLFTAEDNPARSIYESAGFKIRASWADMRRRIR